KTTARLTEGWLKADIATLFSGILTVGLPGVASWRRGIAVLKELGVKTVRLCFDADCRTNATVAHHLAAAVVGLRAEQFTVELEVGDESSGKGIDDVLHAGGTTTLVQGDAAVDRDVRAILEAAGAATDQTQAQAAEAGAAAGEPAAREEPDDPHFLARIHL